MYNDNNNNDYEYHCSYQADGHDPQPTVELESRKAPKKRRVGRRIVAGILCGALLLGTSFGAGWFIKERTENRIHKTQMLVSERPKAEVSTVKVDGSKQLTFPEIYQANLPSSVSINVSSTGVNFFGQPVQRASSGSGFVITADGYIVTNYHVIEGGSQAEVTMSDGKTYAAQFIGGDKNYDIAVLKVDPGEDKLQTVVLGNSGNLKVGEQILAIGNPLGELTFSMSEGIVSSLNREINVNGTPFNMIQVTAAVNAGNSGGPLFNTYGEVVGIVSAKYSSSNSGASVEGLGFAIPIDDVLDMIKDIMENGQITSRPYLGVSVDEAVRYPATGVSAGAYLAEVVENGPAAQAGLQVGDVITMIGSDLITGVTDVKSAMADKSLKAGDTVTITYVREGHVYTTELTLGSSTEMTPTSQQAEQPLQPQQDQSGDTFNSDDLQDFFKEFFGSRTYGG